MNSSKRNWRIYPTTYRAREVKQLAGWIRAGESGSLIGLAGAGKSNLLGFLCHQPEVMADYLGVAPTELAMIHVDLNNLPANDLATFFRVILRSMYEADEAIAEPLRQPVEMLYRKVEDKTDPFLCQSAVREVVLRFQQAQTRLVLIFDPFDQFCRQAETQVLDNLRGLRDSFKATLSYIIGLRRQVNYLRDPLELGELYEIIDSHQCWLGSMEWSDARWVISQVETAVGQSFDEATINQLICLTGGYPALLKPASFWRANLSNVPPTATWLEALSQSTSIGNRLDDLRIGLTGEEEAALSMLQACQAESARGGDIWFQFEQRYCHALNQLAEKKLCHQTEQGWQMFSPLFAHYIAKMDGVSAGRIWYESATSSFWLGERQLSKLSAKDGELLRHFLDHPHNVHSIDDLIEAAWTEDDTRGVSKEAVQQAIRHLRKQIEPNPAKPSYLITEPRVGYRFFPEGAPRG